jgi:UDPglucose 6-dehydrogenase
MIDTTEIINLAEQIGDNIDSYKLIVIKSLVPIGTCKKVKLIIREKIERRNSTASFDIIYNPEFYDRDDSYIDIFADSINPSNIVIGIDRHKSLKSFIDVLCMVYNKEALQKFNVISMEAAEIYAFNSVCIY